MYSPRLLARLSHVTLCGQSKRSSFYYQNEIISSMYRQLCTTSALNKKWRHPFERKTNRLRIRNEDEALEVVGTLRINERQILWNVLNGKMQSGEEVQAEERSTLNSEERRALFIVNALPFVGFGFLDNMIMIVAGEYIELYIGAIFTMSTMAAAGFGNIISDVAGVGLAHYVELLVNKLGFHTPALSPAQWDTSIARWASKGGMAIGLVVGCLFGMFPLLFFRNESEKKEKE